MKAKPYKQEREGGKYILCEPEEATHVELHMPGPIEYRMIPVILRGKRAGTGCWSWNGDTEKPTLKPSIITSATRHITDEEADQIMAGENIIVNKIVCHSWVNDGKAVFLGDCTHEFAGQTVDLLEVD